MASAPSPCNSATSSCPCLSRRPDTTICAPSRAKIIAAARPMPVSAPVINTTGFFIRVDPHVLWAPHVPDHVSAKVLRTTLVRVLVWLSNEGGWEHYQWGRTTQL